MKYLKLGVITLLLFSIVIALTGTVCADQPVPAVPGVQGISAVTSANVVGTTTVTDAVTWTVTNNAGYIPLITDPLVAQWPGYGVDYGGRPDDEYEDYQELLDWYAAYLGEHPGMSFSDFLQHEINDGWKCDVALQAWLLSQTSGIHTGVLDPGQVQYTTAYDSNIVAMNGYATMNKQLAIDTQNKVNSQSNLKAITQVNFLGGEGGNIVGTENIMLDGAGQNTTASDRMLCPFGSYPANVIPKYCNIVQAGSRFDLTEGAVTSQADDRFISSSADTQVELNYNINIKGYPIAGGSGPAIGSVGSYMKAHIQEARGNGTDKSEDIVYSHVASASGYISSYHDVSSYKSGKLLLP